MPDDAPGAAPDVLLRRAHPEVLVVPAGFLDARVEHHEVVHDLEQPLLGAELPQFPQQRIVTGRRMGGGFLPAQPVLFGRLDHSVTQALGVVAGHHQLNGGEERTDELPLLAVEILADAFGHRPRGALQLQHSQGDSVDVEYQVRPLGVLSGDRHLFGDAEVIGAGIVPVDQPDGNGILPELRAHLHPVAKQAVDILVGVVERPAAADRGRVVQSVQRPVDDSAFVTLTLQPVGEKRPFDVAVVGAVLPVAETGIAKRVPEELDHAQLRAEFPFADRAHDVALPRVEAATAALPWSVSRYFWRRLRGRSGRVYSIILSATSRRTTLLS